MKVPNFIIVGAMKSGTTALCEYLREHPAAFISRQKEPYYFATDMPGIRQVTKESDYLKLFSTKRKGVKAFGEGSVWYLYSSKAVENIHTFNPDMKIIIMLRNPIDMIVSWHSQMLLFFEENEADFQRAWHLQAERREGKHLPLKTTKYKHPYQYEQIGKIGQRVKRVLDIFPREQVKMILFDDFITDTKAVYEDVLKFLGLPPDGRTDFPAVNIRRAYRYPRLAWLIFKLVEMLSQLRRRLGIIWNSNVLAYLNRLMTRKKGYMKIDSAFRAELADIFREDLQLLSELVGRDVMHWLDPPKEQN